MRGPSRQVVQAYLGLKLGVWSYNGAVKFWEPVVEPWDVIAQCAANHGSRVREGALALGFAAAHTRRRSCCSSLGCLGQNGLVAFTPVRSPHVCARSPAASSQAWR